MKRFILLGLTAVLTFSIQTASAAVSSRDKVYFLKKKQNEKCRLNLALLYERLKAYATQHGELPKLNNYSGLRKLVENGAPVTEFACESYRGKKAKKINEMQEKTSPCLYFGGINFSQAQKTCPTIPLLCDKPDSRHLNVLLIDGNIITVDLKRMKRKISNCQDIVEALNLIYSYPPDILETLQVKAKLMDKQLAEK